MPRRGLRPVMAEKAALRAEARALRRAIPPEARAEKAERIRAHLMGLPELQGARTVASYVGAGSEVDTSRILRELLARGVRVAVPVEEGERLAWVRLNHPWALVPGPRRILVPRQPWEEVPGGEVDVVLVPGLRFGRDGSRLGQGGGHFDRWLAEHPRALRVGLAFSEQVVDSVPTEPHDQGMDALVTEERRLRIGRPAQGG